jgi:hypothetical protein
MDILTPPKLQRKSLPLVVDLNGALCPININKEESWLKLKYFTARILNPIKTLQKNLYGHSEKAKRDSEHNESRVPINNRFLTILKEEKKMGRNIILISSTLNTKKQLSKDIIELFDEVYEYHGRKLKGDEKALCIKRLTENGEFDYAGGLKSDLAVWNQAKRAFVVQSSLCPRIIKWTKKINSPITIIPKKPKWYLSYLHSLSPLSWVENLLLLVPIFIAWATLASHQRMPLLTIGITTWITLSLLSSGVYLFHNCITIEKDRVKKQYKNNPVASGEIPIVYALWLSFGITLASLMFMLNKLSFQNSAAILTIYLFALILNLHYRDKKTKVKKQLKALLYIVLLSIGTLFLFLSPS